ncbi:Hydroperoxy fatty acid reductase gpx1 [Nitrospira japonica]|uniref:Glutathione peroxidase n=1 Tax=Nitrospira japonica TaxID=1325564 RepID=A0A1W1I6U1_9BACT|nr:glutathione peroxidase [Nitrospira japonica]SLM48732.1 Hydroperoxy fatty acid reductase gpx1 [Nitrospira japonica]
MNLYDIDLVTIDGKPQKMAAYRGRTLLIVNVASECGFTPQYAGLQVLYEKFKDRGFVVLGFPCNQFGHQEPGGEAEIGQFCSRNYGVTFPMFAKIDVNGANAHPLYQYLKSEKPGILGTEAIKWNFTKFLVGSDGTILKRYAPSDKPEAIEADVAAKL